ncbi:MAG: hypothetical protein IT423_02810, partial [Pirellulaceae bacterium]|nr:hypothetical protein [Pirellulaceae bacterium]
MDEAGYGPNLGPMVVAASAWRVPREMGEEQFAQQLHGPFSPLPWSAQCLHIPLGDSKQLYSPAHGLRTLEAGLLAMLAQTLDLFKCLPRETTAESTGETNKFRTLLQTLDVTTAADWTTDEVPGRLPWYNHIASDLPLHVSADEVARLSRLAQGFLAPIGIQLLSVRVLVLVEERFNQLIHQLGSKGRLLSTVTMELVQNMLRDHTAAPVEVFCDRQGGRKKYACVLLEAMPEDWFDTLAEQPLRSSYRRQRAPELKIHFSVGGDSFPPTALASMA